MQKEHEQDQELMDMWRCTWSGNTVLVCDCDCDFVIKLVTKDAECDASLLQSDGQVKVTAL